MFLKINLGGTNLMKKQIIPTLSIIILLSAGLSGCMDEVENNDDNKLKIDFEKEAINFVENLSQYNYQITYEQFDDTMKSVLPVQDLQGAWEGLISTYGEFKEIITTRKTDEENYHIVFVTCNFSILGYLDIRMVFNEENNIAGLQFVPTEIVYEYNPPDYADTNVFEEVNISIGAGEWILPGTLTIPKMDGHFPVVVLIHGSGPNDRDESIGPNKPFKDLAWGLATKGIATLRFEKRTKEYSEKSAALTNFTIQEETIDDAMAAVDFLILSEQINQERIFILGHSLGGMVGPRIVEQDDRIDGLIILAGNTRGLEDLILEQTFYLINLDGKIDENEEIQFEFIIKQVEKVKELNITTDEMVLGAPITYWEDLSEYNPVETANNLSVPILILQGERDYQVTIDGDYSAWDTTFYGNKNVTLKTYETLNHLFIEGSGIPNNAEYLIEGHVEEEVIDDIAEWIVNQ